MNVCSEANSKSDFIMERDGLKCVGSQEQEHLNIANKKERPRMLVYFQEPQGRDHDHTVPVEPEWV
jgi:hypothetical protein